MTESINRILVPVDFSVHSERAIRYATTLAKTFGAQVMLLHVVEDPFVTGAWPATVAPNIPELLSDLIKTATTQLAEIKRRLSTQQAVIVQTAVVKGRPDREIVGFATSGTFDLIVMGTHGRTGLSHALVGSVAERVVQTAPCAVLTVRETDPAALTRAVA